MRLNFYLPFVGILSNILTTNAVSFTSIQLSNEKESLGERYTVQVVKVEDLLNSREEPIAEKATMMKFDFLLGTNEGKLLLSDVPVKLYPVSSSRVSTFATFFPAGDTHDYELISPSELKTFPKIKAVADVSLNLIILRNNDKLAKVTTTIREVNDTHLLSENIIENNIVLSSTGEIKSSSQATILPSSACLSINDSSSDCMEYYSILLKSTFHDFVSKIQKFLSGFTLYNNLSNLASDLMADFYSLFLRSRVGSESFESDLENPNINLFQSILKFSFVLLTLIITAQAIGIVVAILFLLKNLIVQKLKQKNYTTTSHEKNPYHKL